MKKWPKLTLVSKSKSNREIVEAKYGLWLGDVETFLDNYSVKFDLVVTSPPYNIGKEYESVSSMADYKDWQSRIAEKLVSKLSDNGSLCWQVGNHVFDNQILPLDIFFHPLFEELGLKLRNRIIWRFGHGLHCKNRFSGRYESILWYTKGDAYTFNLDDVRIPSKYPGKKAFKGPNAGSYSSNPKGKNPEDVWDFDLDVWEIPNVKANHIEKSVHPCQFPVGLVERLVLALTNPGDLVFDPFAGVGSAGVAAAIHNRRFIGAEIVKEYVEDAKLRIDAAIEGRAEYRPHDKPIYDHTKSKLSKPPSQ